MKVTQTKLTLLASLVTLVIGLVVGFFLARYQLETKWGMP